MSNHSRMEAPNRDASDVGPSEDQQYDHRGEHKSYLSWCALKEAGTAFLLIVLCHGTPLTRSHESVLKPAVRTRKFGLNIAYAG